MVLYTIPEQESIQYLGVTIDNDLSWKSHVGTVRRRMLAAIASIRRFRACSPLSTKQMLYNALVLLYAAYCHASGIAPLEFPPHPKPGESPEPWYEGCTEQASTYTKCPPQKPTWMDHSPQEAPQCTLVPGPLVCG